MALLAPMLYNCLGRGERHRKGALMKLKHCIPIIERSKLYDEFTTDHYELKRYLNGIYHDNVDNGDIVARSGNGKSNFTHLYHVRPTNYLVELDAVMKAITDSDRWNPEFELWTIGLGGKNEMVQLPLDGYFNAATLRSTVLLRVAELEEAGTPWYLTL